MEKWKNGKINPPRNAFDREFRRSAGFPRPPVTRSLLSPFSCYHSTARLGDICRYLQQPLQKNSPALLYRTTQRKESASPSSTCKAPPSIRYPMKSMLAISMRTAVISSILGLRGPDLSGCLRASTNGKRAGACYPTSMLRRRGGSALSMAAFISTSAKI